MMMWIAGLQMWVWLAITWVVVEARPLFNICSDTNMVDILGHIISESNNLPTGVEIVADADGTGYRFLPESRLLHFSSDIIFPQCTFFPDEFSIIFSIKFTTMRNQNQYLLAVLAMDRKTDLFAVKIYGNAVIVNFHVNGKKQRVVMHDKLLSNDNWHDIVLTIAGNQCKINIDCKREVKRILKFEFPSNIDIRRSSFYVASKRMKKNRFTGVIQQVKLLTGSDASIPICAKRSGEKMQPNFITGVTLDQDLSSENSCNAHTKGMLMYRENNKQLDVCGGTSWEKLILTRPRLNYIEEHGEVITKSSTMEIEVFEMKGDMFVAMANQERGKDTDSLLYKWQGDGLVEYQNITTDYAQDWKFFNIGDEYFLAVANQAKDERFPSTMSIVYRFDGVKNMFIRHQFIKTIVAQSCESFKIEDKNFLVIINYGVKKFEAEVSSYREKSWIYLWDSDERMFIPYQSLDTVGGSSVHYFEISKRSYIAVANSFNGVSSKIHSVIYQWRFSQFIPLQYIETTGAHSFEYFQIKRRHFLAVSEYYNSKRKTFDINSTIYEFNIQNQIFEKFQKIPSNGALDMEHFTVGDDHYLIVSSSNNNNISVSNIIYKWQGLEKFLPVHDVMTHSTSDWEEITLRNGEKYLMAGNINGKHSKIFHIRV